MSDRDRIKRILLTTAINLIKVFGISVKEMQEILEEVRRGL